jgi:hypothetical protein
VTAEAAPVFVPDGDLGGHRRSGTGWFSRQWPDLKSAVVGFAVQCYSFDMGWRDVAYAVVMAVVGAVAFTTIIDIGRYAVGLWR